MLYKLFPLYILVFAATLVFTVVFEKRLIPYLSLRAEQPIYEGGPKWHLSKKGTPTMGGLAFLFSISLVLLFSVGFLFISTERTAAISLLIAVIYSLLNSAIGIFDDMIKLKRKENGGLTPIEKLGLQLLLAILFLLARGYFLGISTVISFSFGSIDLGLLYYPLAIIILLGIINCANLTDGVDGLLSSATFAIGVALFYFSYSRYTDVALIAVAIIGGSIGFLFFNINPAKIFMGDTGSLFFGALAASAVFSLSNPLIIILLGGVYVIEGISVILQVLYYKATKKRLFKMAPLHHHLEKCGISENAICIIAMILTFVLSVPAFMLFS